jgi:hypothetical protein
MNTENSYIYRSIQNVVLIGAIPLFAFLLSLLISLFVAPITGFYITIIFVGVAALGASYLATSNIVKAWDIIQPIKKAKEWLNQKKSL